MLMFGVVLGKSKQNGDGVGDSGKKRSRSRERSHRDAADNHVTPTHVHGSKKSQRHKARSPVINDDDL